MAMAATLSFAQSSPAYSFKTVLTPDTVIGYHAFRYDEILNAAVNDRGEVAFMSREKSATNGTVYTLDRKVAAQGDSLDSKKIAYLYPQYPIAINNDGLVAFEAEIAMFDVAIFVERHMSARVGVFPVGFALHDNGEIVLHTSPVDGIVSRESGEIKGLAEHTPLSLIPHSQNGVIVITLNSLNGPYLIVGTPIKQ
jgi:hypothetical protein